MFSCSSPRPASSQRKRATRAAGTRAAPRATIQRSASSGLLQRNGGSVRTKLCDSEQYENLNAGLSAPLSLPSWGRNSHDGTMGPRSPLSTLAVNSPESTTSSPGMTRRDMVRASVLGTFFKTLQ